MKRITLQPSFLLHRRPYRETSFLIDLITLEHGRVSVLARGVRKSKSLSSGILQPFVPLLTTFSGRGELLTLTQAETNGEVRQLYGNCLFAGFYLNELLMCLLQKWDAHPGLYQAYEQTLIILQTSPLDERTLRQFEKHLLEELGYGLLPKNDIALQRSLHPDHYYRFIPDHGFIRSELGDQSQAKSNIFSGKSLLAYANCDWQDEESLQAAKRLTRLVLSPLLGARPIYSRQLFMSVDADGSN